MKDRTVVIGLDGATFDIIDPMIEQGKLPNIARLRQDGASGSLISCNPCLSPAAWTSIMTGKHPGKHGVLDFFGHQPETYKLVYYNASFRRAKPIWTLLSEAGKRVCVLNVPLTYPPDEVNGIMISGMDTPAAESDFIYPSSVRAELEENVGGYLLEKVERDVRDRKTDVFIKNLRDATRNRLEVADYLIQKEDWDLFILVFESGDRAQHQLWKHMDTAHPLYRKKSGTRYGNVIRDVYEDMDARLGELLARIPGNVTTVVLSDHGFGPVYKGVRLNKWLGLNGYLSARHPDRHSANLMMIDQVRRFMPESVKKALKRLVAPERRRKPTLRALDNLEMTGTTVYALGGNGNLYINLKGRQPGGVVEPGQEYEKLREEVIEKMRALKDPEDGRPVVEAVHKREEVYPVYEEHAPDILISWAHGYSFAGERELVAGEKAYDAEGVFVTHKWSGNHRPDGILLLQGDRIRQGCKLSGAQVVDIAPTILALMSTPVPDDMDGKILIEALTEEFVNSGAVTYQEGAQTTEEDSGKKGYTDDEAERVRERLRNLGYIE